MLKLNGVNSHVHEAPLAIGALAGGLIGSAGIAGLTLWSGMALGALGGSLLSSSMKSPKAPQAQNQQSAAAAQTPALPPAAAMPAAPMTPTATPISPNTDAISPDISAIDRPGDAAEASPATTEEIARGQLEKKRKGRLSTILTSPKSRLEVGEDEGFERLGG